MFEQNSWLEIHTLISEKGVALMYLCSRLVLTCTGLVCTWSIVWILFHLFQAEQEVRTWQMSPAKVSWAGKQMRERFCFPGKVTTSSCVSCHEFQCNSAMSMHQAWCAVTNWANLRHQPVVQAVLIASVHDTVALCTILPQWRRELDRFCLQIDMHRICLCTLLSKVMNRPNATILNFHVIEQPCFESSLSLSVFDHCWSQLKDVAGCFLLNSGKKPVGVVYTVSS